MINFKLNTSRRGRKNADAGYLKNFSVAILNYEANRREDKFSFRLFDFGKKQATAR